MNVSSKVHSWAELIVCLFAAILGSSGCHQPEQWCYTGPRVYLIEGTPNERSDALKSIAHELTCQEINAQVYTPDNWLKIVVDIDANPDEEVILVGHGHGAFLCTQVVRHYAQCHKMKHIDAVFTIDAYKKDWPHNAQERGDDDPHEPPMPIPIGHNAIKVRNYVQQNPDSTKWGSDLVSTRASNIAEEHPFYWYDDYWIRREVTGQHLAHDLTDMGVTHETIDNYDRLVQRIVRLCRKAALSPYHYTPPEHHVDVAPKALPIPTPTGSRKTAALGPPA
ncbi:MAG TPA: hypothetical protein VJZ71_05465 [Phycisphaerae bacterium]|nr:hypothetical protein [Phycisphaerae bacterium]